MSAARPLVWALLAFTAVCLASRPALAQPGEASNLPRIAVEDRLDADLPPPFGSAPLPFRVAARVLATGDPLSGIDAGRLDARLEAYARRGVPVWLSVAGPAAADAASAWRTALGRLLERHAAALAIVEVSVDRADPKLAAYAVRLAATDTRARRADIRIALSTPPAVEPAAALELLTPELAPYVDLVAVPADAAIDALAAGLLRIDPTAALIVTGLDAGSGDAAGVRHVLDRAIGALGTTVVLQAWRPSAALDGGLRGLAPLAPLLAGDVSALDPAAASLSLSVGGAPAVGRHRLLFEGRAFATYLIYDAEAAPEPLDVSLTLPVEGVPAVYRLADGTRLDVLEYTRTPETGRVRVRVPATAGPILVDFNHGAAEAFVDRSEVRAERRLTVDEIIARHQQQQRAQDALVRNYTAAARMEQHFRPTMTDPGYDVVTENRYYVADDGIEWEEASFSVNGSRWGSDRPAFPLLQPEKVLSLPLQLRFDADYRYRLAGVERVRDHDCYVIRFEPLGEGRSLYRGTLWIDRRTFARVQVRAVQTSLSAPVVSNEELQVYTPVAILGNHPVYLFTELSARQIMLIAGRNLLVEKRVVFSDFRVNDARFEQVRTEARRSDRVMYRETDRGLRYFVKDGDTRVVSERATRTARAMAMGVTLDPSYGFPLPIFGLNYLNFEFLRRPDTQLAVLFAGVLAAGNVQRSDIGGTPLDASVDFFAIAAPSTERIFDAGGEREAERLLTWPLTVGGNLGWQFTPFQKLTGQYHFRFDGYARERTTAASFRVPASSITNGVGGTWDYRRGGYTVLLAGTWYARTGWAAWGTEGAEPASQPVSRYAKYSASVSRDFFFDPFQKLHFNGAWFGGRNLDRFAKYQFGMFDDTRIHGVPASGVRFGELAVARGAYSLNIFEQYRLDLFLEQAWGRDRAFDDRWQPITGIGAAVNFRAPWNTILRADVGKSFLPERYRGAGSATLQLMLLKPLR